MIGATVDYNQLFQTFCSNLPATIAAVAAAMIAWHGRSIGKDTNKEMKATKVMVNGRMDQLLAAATELAEIKGRAATVQEIKEISNVSNIK